MIGERGKEKSTGNPGKITLSKKPTLFRPGRKIFCRAFTIEWVFLIK